MSRINKSASTPAIFQYATLTKRIFTSPMDDRSAWIDITQMLYHLREAVTCVVCANIAVMPHCPATNRCSHHVCQDCRGMPTMRPHCTVCKEAAATMCFKMNTQVERLINCFEKLCKFLISSQALTKWESLSTQTLYGETITFGQLVREGSNFRRPVGSPNNGYNGSSNSNEVFKKKSSVKEKEHHCRCGSGAHKRDSKPGNLTCRGQRCACYTEGRNCSNCRCAGCMNPNGTPISTNGQAAKH